MRATLGLVFSANRDTGCFKSHRRRVGPSTLAYIFLLAVTATKDENLTANPLGACAYQSFRNVRSSRRFHLIVRFYRFAKGGRRIPPLLLPGVKKFSFDSEKYRNLTFLLYGET